ncbi:hypothetical protein V8E54_006892 [Elaphomyces granulatus]
MMRPNDPRIRQTINQITHNLESANETAREGVYNFAHEYLSPCFATIGGCIRTCTAPCFPSREDQLRRRRRGRAELSFDFYDDWDNEAAGDGLLGWDNDELDRLLAGSSNARGPAEQPRRQRKMSYGTRGVRRRNTVLPDERHDPTVIPKSSVLGFLERFPWRIGSRGIKYRPSAADLQERPGRVRADIHENQPLMEATDESDGDSEHGGADRDGKPGRTRSGTQSSRETSNSLSSRGDLIPSDDEEDAVPLDDEFAVALTRRGTGFSSEDQLSGKPNVARRSGSGTASRDTASRDSRSTGRGKVRGDSKGRSSGTSDVEIIRDTEPLGDLLKEEESVKIHEESEIAKNRLAAHRLAINRGLGQNDQSTALLTTQPNKTPSEPESNERQALVSALEGPTIENNVQLTSQFPTQHLSLEQQQTDSSSPRPSPSSINRGSAPVSEAILPPSGLQDVSKQPDGHGPSSEPEAEPGGD